MTKIRTYKKAYAALAKEFTTELAHDIANGKGRDKANIKYWTDRYNNLAVMDMLEQYHLNTCDTCGEIYFSEELIWSDEGSVCPGCDSKKH